MKVFLIDGTYELFRQFYGRPGHKTDTFGEVDAVRGVLGVVLSLLEQGATHIGVATDHVIESFRNPLWAGYKTGDGIDAELWSQFPLLEDSLMAMGVTTWPMIELEADDGLASAAAIVSTNQDVEQVAIMSPDKDLAQCVTGSRIVQVDQRRNIVYDEAGVIEKFGVPPSSIPDYLALVGDSADGYPGLQGWGAKGTAAVLREFGTIENIPLDVTEWKTNVRGAKNLAAVLNDNHENALLFKHLATLRIDRELVASTDDLRWQGPKSNFEKLAKTFDGDRLVARVQQLHA